MFIVIDASVWAARLVSQDVFYEPVKEWMSARIREDDQFLAPSLLLAEIGGAISRPLRATPSLGRKAIAQVQNLPGLQLVEMENSLLLDKRSRRGRSLGNLSVALTRRPTPSRYIAGFYTFELS